MEGSDKCPFCGQLATIHRAVKTAPTARKGLQIECMNCGARGPIFGDKKMALLGWRHVDMYRVDESMIEAIERIKKEHSLEMMAKGDE